MTENLPPGPLMLDIEGLVLSAEDRRLIRSPAVGGLILFSRNFQSIEQLQELIADVRAARKQLIIAVDQEGGRVQRFKTGFTRIPPMSVLGVLYDRDPTHAISLTHELGWLLAAELLSCDVDISFAPVLDLDYGVASVIGDRAFGQNPDKVVALTSALIEGMHEAGMASTGKHYPGHGGVAADSHHAIPVDERSFDEIEKADLVPFRKLAQTLDAVMPAHVIYSEVDDQPAGFSSHWLQLLRHDYRFDGVIFSDDLSMEGASVAGNFTARTKAAMVAGCDMVLVCNNRQGAEEVCAHFETQGFGENPRLNGMLRRGQPASSLAALRDNPRWQKAVAAIEQLNSEFMVN